MNHLIKPDLDLLRYPDVATTVIHCYEDLIGSSQ